MKEERYHIALDDYEHGVVIRALNDTKTELMNEGKSTDAVDDLIIKVGYAPKKKFKVVERKDCSCRESRERQTDLDHSRRTRHPADCVARTSRCTIR